MTRGVRNAKSHVGQYDMFFSLLPTLDDLRTLYVDVLMKNTYVHLLSS